MRIIVIMAETTKIKINKIIINVATDLMTILIKKVVKTRVKVIIIIWVIVETTTTTTTTAATAVICICGMTIVTMMASKINVDVFKWNFAMQLIAASTEQPNTWTNKQTLVLAADQFIFYVRVTKAYFADWKEFYLRWFKS